MVVEQDELNIEEAFRTVLKSKGGTAKLVSIEYEPGGSYGYFKPRWLLRFTVENT